jgi:hypothetical protein
MQPPDGVQKMMQPPGGTPMPDGTPKHPVTN